MQFLRRLFIFGNFIGDEFIEKGKDSSFGTVINLLIKIFFYHCGFLFSNAPNAVTQVHANKLCTHNLCNIRHNTISKINAYTQKRTIQIQK